MDDICAICYERPITKDQVFNCNHNFCDICTSKIDKCGFCRAEQRHGARKIFYTTIQKKRLFNNVDYLYAKANGFKLEESGIFPYYIKRDLAFYEYPFSTYDFMHLVYVTSYPLHNHSIYADDGTCIS